MEKTYDDINIIYDVAATADGGIVAVGYTASPEWRAVILKTDGNGQREWTKFFEVPFAKTPVAKAVVQNSDGSYLIAGYAMTGDPLVPQPFYARLY